MDALCRQLACHLQTYSSVKFTPVDTGNKTVMLQAFLQCLSSVHLSHRTEASLEFEERVSRSKSAL